MTKHKIIVQNIGRTKVGKVRGGGNCARLRIDTHNEKPTFLILAEINEEEGYSGVGAFRGYSLKQFSQNGARAGGIAVFVRKNIIEIENTIRNSQNGHFTTGAYNVNGSKVVLGAIYGPSTNSDTESYEIFSEFTEQIRELAQRIGTNTIFIGGDFNLKLDQNRVKPRTVKLMQDFILEFNLTDAGAECGAEATWRRPRRCKSRLDYILYSRAKMTNFRLNWVKGDHAQLVGDFDIGDTEGGGGPSNTKTGP